MRPKHSRKLLYTALAGVIFYVVVRAGIGPHASLTAFSVALVAAVAWTAGKRSAVASLRQAEERRLGLTSIRNQDLSSAVDELRREISQHHTTARKLQECEKCIGLMTEYKDEWICLISSDSRILYVSPSSERITGYAPREFLSDPAVFLSITHKEDRETMANHLESPPSPGEKRSFDYRIIHKNGDTVWLSHTCVPVAAEGGELPEILLCNRNITARKRVEEHVKRLAGAEGLTLADSSGIQADLQRALHKDEFIVFYQPLVNIASGRVTAVEALIRWQHPTRGLIPPADFMDEAEASGLIIPMGIAILRDACEELARWDSLGMFPMHLCVNLSPRQFQDPSMPDEIERILRNTRIDPGRIELEITEQTAMSHGGAVQDTMDRLRSMGLHLSLDNYGSGSSSLKRLMRWPIESIKIDRSFIQASTRSEKDAAAARGVINMARSLRLKVVAEGVERPEQLEFLRREGCGDYQGFLFSPPVSGAELERLLVTVESAEAEESG